MKALKYVGIGVAALVAVAIIGAVVVASTVDPNEYKPQIVRLVKEKYGRTLAIDGTIGLTFFPRIGASVEKLTLSEPNSERAFAKIGEAKVAVGVLPLFSGKVVVDRVELSGLEANLVKHKDGRTNIDDLLGKTDEKKPAPKGEEKKGGEPGAPMAIDISGISLRGATLGWRDEAKGSTLRASGVNLSTGRIASGEGGKLSFSGRVQGDQPKLDLELKLSSGYRLDFEKPAVQLTGLDAEVQGDAAGTTGLKGKLSGDVGWSGDNRLELSSVKLDASSKDGLEAKFNVPKLSLSPERSESSAIDGTLRMAQGARKVDAKIALAAAKAAGERLDFSSLNVELDLKEEKLAVKGKLATPVSLRMDASQVSLPQLAGGFSVTGPAVPNQSLQLSLNGSAQANWEKKNVQADLAARFDESNAKLKLSIPDYSKLVPQFELLVDRLNVDRYTGGGKQASAASSKSGDQAPPAPAKDEPIDLAGLKSFDGSGNIRIGNLVASGVKAESVHVGVKAAGGRVELNPVSANLYQGSAAGSVSVNANNNQFVVRQKLANVSVGPLLRDAADKDILEGRGSVNLDLTTTGNTVSAMKRALNGKADLALRDGAIKGIDLGSIARRARALRSGSLESAANAKAEKTDFSELTATFNIKNGVARNDDLAVKSPFIRIGGAGEVDIGAGAMNYTVKASIVATTTGQEGKALADVRGLTFPVKVSGPFENLKYSVDAGALVAETAKEEVRKRVEERLGKGGLGETLKGLLGR